MTDISTRRRKDVPCVICGKPTRTRSAVCGPCVHDADVGHRVREKKAETGPVVTWIADLDYSFAHQKAGTLDRRDSEKELSRAFEALLRAIGGSRTDHEPTWDVPGVEKVRVDHDSRYGDTPYYREWVLPRTLAAELNALVNAIQGIVSSAYINGVDMGESFIARIAQGDVSIEDINEHEVLRAQHQAADLKRATEGKKPQ